MNFLLNLAYVVQIVSALGMIGLILIQHGKGADMGAAFGSGGSGSVFGASGSANFLSRATAALAAVFFICTLALAYFGFSVNVGASSGNRSVLDRAPVTAPASAASAALPAASVASAASAAGVVPGTAGSIPTPTVPASGAAQIPTK